MTDSLQPSSAPGQPQPLNDAITSLPPHMVPPLQFLHVPARPGSNRRQKSAHQLPSKVPIPLYTLKKLPTPEALINPPQPPPAFDASRPPTAPSSATLPSRSGSAQTARVLFSRFHPSSATATVASSNGERCGSTGVRLGSSGDEAVSWTERSPRVAAGTRSRAPPLADAINAYLARELKLLGDATECSEEQQTTSPIDPMEALQPHREAFRMLAEGLPSYASLMCNIMIAFDSAIKSQACVTSAARVISSTAYQVRMAHESEVSDLRREIEAVEERCRQSQLALQSKLADAKASTSVGVISNLEQENISLKAQLGENQLEKTNDLEKFMTLIAAIKECDNRVKTLEDALQDARIKLDDMHMLKKMMGESQSELGQLKATYRDAVPLARFTNATRELEEQLRESKRETKRVRRLCIARGSAIDILERKLKAATDELERFRMAAGSKSIREALTPRPDWLSVQESIPELGEFAADIPVEMIDVDGQQPRKIVGMKDTSLQVSFLVDKIAELQAALDAAKGNQQSTSPVQMEVTPPSTLKQRQSIVGAALSPTSKASLKEISLPMFAMGLNATTTPSHLREIGTIPRITMETARIKELILEFFSGNLRKTPEAALVLTSAELSKHLLAFCTLTFAMAPEIRQQYSGNAVYLVHNLIEQSMHSSVPQLVLFRHVMGGTMPLRIAFDALDVIGEVRRELNALCEAHNKTRLRRATVVELIIPLLPFKTRDEIEELRVTLGVENTIDVAALVAPTSKLMGTLFEQECLEGMKLYSAMVERLSASSAVTEGVRTTSTSAVLDALAVVEPKTSQRVIDALIVGDVTDETVFPLEHTIAALRTTPLVRLSCASKA